MLRRTAQLDVQARRRILQWRRVTPDRAAPHHRNSHQRLRLSGRDARQAHRSRRQLRALLRAHPGSRGRTLDGAEPQESDIRLENHRAPAGRGRSVPGRSLRSRKANSSMRDTTVETRRRLYRMMYLIRRTEEMLMAKYHPANEMRCPMHFCVGQEAMPAALAQVLRRDDVLMSHYRSHGYYLAKGAPLDAMVAEFYGKETGSNSGIAGSMELGAHDHNFYSGAIVAGSLFIPFG